MRQAYIIVVLLLTALLILGACTPAPEPAPTPVPPPEESLTAPELVSPHNRATDTELRPILLWHAVPEARGYELKVSRNSDFSDTVITTSFSDTSYEFLKYLSPLTRYYWMVSAKISPENPDAPVAYSEVWSFTTKELTSSEPTTPLRPPALPEPTPSPEPVPITAARLSTEVDETGSPLAAREYNGQMLEVSGTFDHFEQDIENPSIFLETDPDDAYEIWAFLNDDQVSKAQTLAKGDEIVVLGRCVGIPSYRIILADCQIIVP